MLLAMVLFTAGCTWKPFPKSSGPETQRLIQDPVFDKAVGNAILDDNKDSYICMGIQEPADGDEYIKSIKKMFPSQYQKELLNPSGDDSSSLKEQQENYAGSYLETIGRNAAVGEYRDFEYVLMSDVGISEKADNMIFKNLGEYPYWIGTCEKLENGVRVVYETQYRKEEQSIILVKYDYNTKNVLEKRAFDAGTGEKKEIF